MLEKFSLINELYFFINEGIFNDDCNNYYMY